MAGSYRTTDDAARVPLRTLRVPQRVEGIWAEAKTLAEDLPGWRVVSVDEERRVLTCERARGFLGGRATVTITVEGPDDVPSATVHVESTSEGGLLSRDKANVAEFLGPLHRRVC